MNLKDNILIEDLQYIASSDVDFNQFKDKTILITGATGLIGSLLVKSLLYSSYVNKLNTKVIALVRNEEKAKGIFSDFIQYGDLEFYIFDLEKNEKINISEKVDYIIHAASITTSKVMVENPVGTIKTAIQGTTSILDFAVDKKVKSMVYVSSMEVYGVVNKEGKVKEDELGYVNLQSARSSYPEGKRMCECICNAYFNQYSLNVSSARLAQTFGPGILPGENRVFAQFANSVIEEKDIVLHTLGKSEGNYVYTRDAIRALLMMLYKGKGGEAYNIVNEGSHTTIADMAKMVAEKAADNKIKVIFDIPEDLNKLGYAPDTKLFLDGTKIKELGWEPEVGLLESYKRLIMFMEQGEY